MSPRLLQRQIQRRARQGLQRRAKEEPSTSSVLETAGQGVAGGGGALPHQETIQRSFGRHDVSGIRVHTDEGAGRAAAAIGAEAYATGNDVAFASAPSLHTAAHEAAHVVQQKQGVQLLGGVGQVGDAYEQQADRVADAVVAGRSAEGLLDQVPAGGGGAGIQRRVVQRELGLGRSAGVDEQLSEKVAKANPVADVDKNAPNSPLSHPYFPTFKARVLALFAHGGAPKNKDPAALAEELWQGVCGAISQSQGQMADENTYQNKDKAKGWVDMSSAAFQAAIATFEKTLATLQQYPQSQFAKCNTFGFWSTPTGKELAEHHCDVTLETSGVGALFDGMAA